MLAAKMKKMCLFAFLAVPLAVLTLGISEWAYGNDDDEFDEFQKHGINEIWVTPKIPFMIPLLGGFICTFILGDILFFIMNLFR